MKIYSITTDDKFKEYAEIGFETEHLESIFENWLDWLILWLTKVTQAVYKHGLKGQGENHT